MMRLSYAATQASLGIKCLVISDSGFSCRRMLTAKRSCVQPAHATFRPVDGDTGSR
jgi:hypothetical protein